MKKVLVLLACVALILALGACGNDLPGKNVVNPMKEFDTPDFTSSTGFKVDAYPTEFQLDSCATVADKIGQMMFTIDGGKVTFRMAATATNKNEDISGVHGEFQEVTTADIAGVPVKLSQTPGELGKAEWQKDGYDFSLVVEKPGERGVPELAQIFIEKTVMSPVA